MNKLNELINKYNSNSAIELELEIKKLTGISFKKGKEMSIRDYAIQLGQFKTYYHQRVEAEAKLEEILGELRKVMKE